MNPTASAPGYSTSGVNEAESRSFLSGCGWPPGLQEVLLNNMTKIPIRFFICDDSGSMIANDGHKLLSSNGMHKMVSCTRWSELSESLKFHANLARVAKAPSEFRLLNKSRPLMIGVDNDDQNYRTFMGCLDEGPNGGTPLCKHLAEVITVVRGMEPQLRAAGQKAAVIICTDGESSDGDLTTAMKPLEQLPVWVVVRLCTDEDKIVNYWNNIDAQLELDMDVLDDLGGEAEEVYEHNPWLNYCEPMHRLREFGIPTKEIDLLDEAALTLDQIRLFCTFIFGGSLEKFPHPDLDHNGFIRTLRKENSSVKHAWSPIHKREREWIDIAKLRNNHHAACCTIS